MCLKSRYSKEISSAREFSCSVSDIEMSEPTTLKIFEHAYYIGNYVGGVLWGKHLLQQYMYSAL
jgi:hypothetical protein